MLGLSSRQNLLDNNIHPTACRPLSRRTQKIHAYFPTPAEIVGQGLYKSLNQVINRARTSSSSLRLVVSKPVVDVPPPHLYMTDAQSRLLIQADYRSSLEASIWMNLAVSSSPLSPPASSLRSSPPRNPSGLQPPRYIKMPDGGNIVISPSVGSIPPSQIAKAMLSYGSLKLSSGEGRPASASVESLVPATAA